MSRDAARHECSWPAAAGKDRYENRRRHCPGGADPLVRAGSPGPAVAHSIKVRRGADRPTGASAADQGVRPTRGVFTGVCATGLATLAAGAGLEPVDRGELGDFTWPARGHSPVPGSRGPPQRKHGSHSAGVRSVRALALVPGSRFPVHPGVQRPDYCLVAQFTPTAVSGTCRWRLPATTMRSPAREPHARPRSPARKASR